MARYENRQNPGNPPSGTPRAGGENRRRRPMTEAEYRAQRPMMEAERERRRHAQEMQRVMQKQETMRRRRRARQVFLGRLGVFAVVVLIMLALSAGVFLLLFRHAPDQIDAVRYTYTYGGRETRRAPFESACQGKIFYFCFDDLADYLNMAKTGTAAERRYLFSSFATDSEGGGSEEYVRFPDGAAMAEVNGQDIPLDGKNRLLGEEVWVSIDFLTDVMNNLSVQVTDGSIAISKIKDDVHSTEKLTLYLAPQFRLKPADPLETVPESTIFVPAGEETGETAEGGGEQTPMETITFATDLSAYEKYMNPENRDDFLILVNTKNTLSADYVPNDLLDAPSTAPGRSNQQLREYACKSLEALLTEMRAAGYTGMIVNSGFRTYSYQAMLFETYTNNEMTANPNLSREEAEKIVLTYSTRPGTSEHQSGLAVDMATDSSFSTDFQYADEYKWLQENAWKFGFILRFPADKTEITTIQFEPWHYRFVGRYHAKKIHDAGVCLEEYVESLAQ